MIVSWIPANTLFLLLFFYDVFFIQILFHLISFCVSLCLFVPEEVVEMWACLKLARRSKTTALRIPYNCMSDVLTFSNKYFHLFIYLVSNPKSFLKDELHCNALDLVFSLNIINLKLGISFFKIILFVPFFFQEIVSTVFSVVCAGCWSCWCWF